MALINLIYVSNAHSDLDPGELGRILASSARNNQPRHITGMLLYANGSFMQVLEGEEAAVDEIYGLIEQDPRHTSLFVIEREPIVARSFDRWSMGFKHLDASDAAAHPAYAPFFSEGFDAAAIGARKGLALDILRNFADSQGA